MFAGVAERTEGLTEGALLLQWGNLAAVGFLLIAPNNRQLEAMVYALTDGPLAAALMAWQSAWVFGSTEHSIRCTAYEGMSSGHN